MEPRCVHDQIMHVAMPKIVSLCVWVSVHGSEIDAVALYTNKAAVYFEQQAWEQCLELCDKSVEVGSEHRADYKLIAKALARKGNVYLKQEQWEDAIKWFDKSLTEHTDQEVVKRKQKAEKVLAEIERQRYIDPEKSAEEKEKGNDLFKKGNYPEAVKCYTEAIRRNPEDARLYSNRAACYTKLAEFRLGLQDCEECLRLEPGFVKAYTCGKASSMWP